MMEIAHFFFYCRESRERRKNSWSVLDTKEKTGGK